VCYFQADSKYTRVVTVAEDRLIRKADQGALRGAPILLLWQVHRSTIVNVHAIAGVVRDLRGAPRCA